MDVSAFIEITVGCLEMVPLGYLIGRKLRRKRIAPIKNSSIKIYPWLWNKYKDRFICPKCLAGLTYDYQPPLCECEEYYESHFHFECIGCKFKTLMQTADK